MVSKFALIFRMIVRPGVFSLIVASAVFSQNEHLVSQRGDSEQFASYAEVRAVVILDEQFGRRPKTEASDDDIRQAVELVRQFIWRNSRCRIHFRYRLRTISIIKNQIAMFRYGDEVASSLETAGVSPDSIDMVILLYPGGQASRALLNDTIFDTIPFISIPVPCKQGDPYPVQLSLTAQSIISPLIKAFCHIWGPRLLSLSPDKSIRDTGFKQFARLLHKPLSSRPLPVPVFTFPDADGDSLPAAVPHLPMDEKRFGSDSLRADTDGDGISDLQEFAGNVYKSTSPVRPDSDFDGIPDNVDPYPTNPSPYEIPEFTPPIRGDLDDWYWLTDVISFSSARFATTGPLKARLYVSRSREALYFALRFNAPADITIQLDAGGDGWYQGRNNYYFLLDPFTDRFNEIKVLDMTERAQFLPGRQNTGMWDDESAYERRFGRLINEQNVSLITRCGEQQFEIRIVIPASELPGRFLAIGNKLGLRIDFQNELDGTWASIFSPYDFFYVTLK